MEFIEGEKNFNKVLCRLSSILHQDDPQYLDLDLNVKDDADHLEDTVKKETVESVADTAASDVVRHVKELLLVKSPINHDKHKTFSLMKSLSLSLLLYRKTSITVMNIWQDFKAPVTN
jgi:hypothetical protein